MRRAWILCVSFFGCTAQTGGLAEERAPAAETSVDEDTSVAPDGEETGVADTTDAAVLTDAAETSVAETSEPSNDGYPLGAIAFFSATACPAGWAPYGEANGRTIVPLPSGGTAAATVGGPMNGAPTHGHAATSSITLGEASYAAIGGAGNGSLTSSGTHVATITAAPTESAVPFVALLSCRKALAPANRPLPTGIVAFFDTSGCPVGYSELVEARGRVLVALPVGGHPHDAFGGAPLSDQEARPHTHDVTASLGPKECGVAVASGSSASGYGKTGSHSLSATTTPASTGLAYLQLVACAKD